MKDFPGMTHRFNRHDLVQLVNYTIEPRYTGLVGTVVNLDGPYYTVAISRGDQGTFVLCEESELDFYRFPEESSEPANGISDGYKGGDVVLDPGTPTTINFSNGSTIKALPIHEGESVRGLRGSVIYFDEASEQYIDGPSKAEWDYALGKDEEYDPTDIDYTEDDALIASMRTYESEGTEMVKIILTNNVAVCTTARQLVNLLTK